MKQDIDIAEQERDTDIDAERPEYHPPQVKVIDEAEVLKVFQITSAGASWWN